MMDASHQHLDEGVHDDPGRVGDPQLLTQQREVGQHQLAALYAVSRRHLRLSLLLGLGLGLGPLLLRLLLLRLLLLLLLPDLGFGRRLRLGRV